MKSITTLLSASALFVLASVPSQAMPLPAAGPDIGNVTLVAQGCGPGGHRGPWGHCRALFTCPRGWHTGPYGKVCSRNR
jgi:hypothetical protein